MTAACEVLPGHTYLMPAGSATCLRGYGWERCGGALCELSRRSDDLWMVARYAQLGMAAAREARAGHRGEAKRLLGLRREVEAWLELNPCAPGAMIEVTT